MLIILIDRKVAESTMAEVLMLTVLMDHRETLLVMQSHSKDQSIVEAFTAIRSSVTTEASAIIAKATVVTAAATAVKYSTSVPAAITGSPGGLIAPPS